MFKAVVVVGAILVLQSCSTFSEKQPKPPGVTSNPSGATVYANGVKQGKTPLHYDPVAAFPAGWSGGAYQAQGVLTVKKDGCEDFAIQVSDPILSKPVHAELECDEMDTAEKAAVVEVVPEPVSKTPAKNIEQRLDELESLYKKGAVTESERNAIRERILNEL